MQHSQRQLSAAASSAGGAFGQWYIGDVGHMALLCGGLALVVLFGPQAERLRACLCAVTPFDAAGVDRRAFID